jgi:hypothetical protein
MRSEEQEAFARLSQMLWQVERVLEEVGTGRPGIRIKLERKGLGKSWDKRDRDRGRRSRPGGV